RLRSLSSDPAAFGQSWDKESTYEDKVWQKRVREAAWFLAVEDTQPVAVVAARREADSPEHERELRAGGVTHGPREERIALRLAVKRTPPTTRARCRPRGSPAGPARRASPSCSPRRSSSGRRRTAPTPSPSTSGPTTPVPAPSTTRWASRTPATAGSSSRTIP